MHGEALHLTEHAKLARSLGVKEVVRCRNGDLVRLAPSPAHRRGAGRPHLQGRPSAGGSQQRTVADRRRLSFAGAISVALALTDKGEMVGDPEVDLIGMPERDRAGELLDDIVYAAVLETFEILPRGRRRDPDFVAEAIRRGVRSAVASRWGKKPMCHVHVLAV